MMKKISRRAQNFVPLIGALLLFSGCGGGGGSAGNGNSTPVTNPNNNPGTPATTPATTYSIGGVISGLNQVIATSNGSITFNPSVPADGTYLVTVEAQPVGQICTVANGAGSALRANMTNVNIVCSTDVYTISGTMTGLAPGAQIVLLNNNDDALTVSANAHFSFATPVAYNGAYAVTIGTHPKGETCQVTAGNGNSLRSDVSNVAINCLLGTESVLYSFGSSLDAVLPGSGLMLGSDGDFYGTTMGGGSNGAGTVFKITPTGSETILHSFAANGTDGVMPTASLIQAANGTYYGTAYNGGSNDSGIFFGITASGTENILYSFGSPTNGKLPGSNLIIGNDGNFYGTTIQGGTNGLGSVFKMTPSGVETILYSFGAAPDGYVPAGALVLATDGNFYGVTSYGGKYWGGTVFKLTPAGVETVLYSFGASNSDNSRAGGALIQAGDGNFYGTASAGGAGNQGTVYKMTPAGTVSILYAFTGPSDGNGPIGALVEGADGNFYGATSYGGTFNQGMIFAITPAGIETVHYSLGAGTDARNPNGSLVLGRDGNLYGASFTGGTYNKGTVFKIGF